MSLTLQDKAFFYQKLAAGEKAGLTPGQIIDAGLLPKAWQGRREVILKALEKGSTLVASLQAGGLISPWEAALINIGEQTGRLETVLSRLDDFFTAKVSQFGHVRRQLVTPGLTLLVAILVLPLPAVAAGSLPLVSYALRSLLAITVLLLCYHHLIVRPFARARLGAFNPLLLKSLSLVRNPHFLRRMFDVAYLDMLTLCLDSGMDAVQALKLMSQNMIGKKQQRRHMFAISKIDKSGASLAEALGGQGIIGHPEVLSFLAACEASGTLHSDMREYLWRQRREIDGTVDYWLRRLGVAVFIAVAGYTSLKIVPYFMALLMR